MSETARARAARVESWLRGHAFARDGGPLRLGAEMELLAVDAITRRVAPVAPREGPGTLDVVREAAARLGWRELRSDKGAPRFLAAGGGALTFEPGGQLEYASAVHGSVDGVVRELAQVHGVLAEHAAAHGIALLACGVDPENGPEGAALQLAGERYRRMAAYLATIGPDGARMMRQTASLQLCLGGVDVAACWRLANALAPFVVALFASSPRYAGEDTGCVSYRAETWRGVDPWRTGILDGDDPLREYAAFALRAPAFLAGPENSPPRPFAALADDDATDDALVTHLSTLFPEVRPRGYLELRSADAVEVRLHGAAFAFVVGLLADERTRGAALEITGVPDASLLRVAGRAGLDDPTLLRRARELVELALVGCARLGPAVVGEPVIEDAARGLAGLLAAPRRRGDLLAAAR